MKTILFACTENRKRSKIAEAVFNHLANAKDIDMRAISAGTAPASEVDPLVTQILSEKGVVASPKKPQQLTDELLEKADRIVSFGCLIPDMFPKDKFEEWRVDDPETPEEYQEVFQIIFERVEGLLQKTDSR
ncbi:MAG: low molecular weight phosphatase family protein [Candidatus Paceibacterota bacterium]